MRWSLGVRTLLSSLLLFLLALSGCGRSSAEISPALVSPELVATDLTGAPFALSSERGRVVLLAFGYAHCPDVCPMTLTKLSAVLRGLGGDASHARALFLTVDPLRDQPEPLRRYLAAFDARIVGLRLEEPGLTEALASLGASAVVRLPESRAAAPAPGRDAYAIDHTAGILLFDKEGRLRQRHRFDATPEEVTREARRLIAEPRALEVSGGVARLAPGGVGAIYLTVENRGKQSDRLLSARSPQAGKLDLHELVLSGELVQMVERADGFEVPAKGALSLTPGGKHLMFEGVEPADRLALVLRFARAGEVALEVPLRTVGN